MGSKRLPGKSLMKISGRPIIGHLVDAVLQIADRDDIVIATSLENIDDEIEEFCKQNNCSKSQRVIIKFGLSEKGASQ